MEGEFPFGRFIKLVLQHLVVFLIILGTLAAVSYIIDIVKFPDERKLFLETMEYHITRIVLVALAVDLIIRVIVLLLGRKEGEFPFGRFVKLVFQHAVAFLIILGALAVVYNAVDIIPFPAERKLALETEEYCLMVIVLRVLHVDQIFRVIILLFGGKRI
jgi:hypothetical protein